MNPPPNSNDTFLGLPKLPPSAAAWVQPLMLSILMTCIVSLVSSVRAMGWTSGSLRVWLQAWGLSWLIAFPTLLLVLPLVRRATAALVRSA